MARAFCLALALCVVLVAPAAADTFGGFSSIEPSYLVNQDRVCGLLTVTDGVAAGAPRCQRAPADRLATLRFAPGTSQRGAKAAFTATADGRTLVVARQGGAELVRWEALDPISRVQEVLAKDDDRVAVTFLVRRGGRELTDVVAFSLARPSPDPAKPALDPAKPAPDPAKPAPDPAKPAPDAGPASSPELERAIAAARKARGKAQAAAWARVLTLAPEHAEALYRQAAAAAAGRDRAGALSALTRLGASTAADAIEHRVAARFDAAFASLRADPVFRKATGLDRKPEHPYEKTMGFGGIWEQAGTSCDSPTVALTFTRDKKFRLQVRTVCEGMTSQSKFAGTWRVEGAGLALTLPNRDIAADQIRCTFEPSGDEEALSCPLDDELRIVVLPARR